MNQDIKRLLPELSEYIFTLLYHFHTKLQSGSIELSDAEKCKINLLACTFGVGDCVATSSTADHVVLQLPTTENDAVQLSTVLLRLFVYELCKSEIDAFGKFSR